MWPWRLRRHGCIELGMLINKSATKAFKEFHQSLAKHYLHQEQAFEWYVRFETGLVLLKNDEHSELSFEATKYGNVPKPVHVERPEVIKPGYHMIGINYAVTQNNLHQHM